MRRRCVRDGWIPAARAILSRIRAWCVRGLPGRSAELATDVEGARQRQGQGQGLGVELGCQQFAAQGGKAQAPGDRKSVV